jgi:hypothetical protein
MLKLRCQVQRLRRKRSFSSGLNLPMDNQISFGNSGQIADCGTGPHLFRFGLELAYASRKAR